VSATDVHRAKKTHANKYKPSKSLEQDCKHDKEINMLKEDDWSNKRQGERHIEKTHQMTFVHIIEDRMISLLQATL